MNMQCFIAFCIACIALVAGFGENNNDVYDQQFAPVDNTFFRSLRSSNGKPTFIRFGRGKPTFIRFGRSAPTYSNFENQDQEA